MDRPLNSATGAFALAAALFPATTCSADTPSGVTPNSVAAAPSDSEVRLPTVPTLDGAPIPERILRAALAANLDPSSIKVEGGQWVGCNEGDACIPLGAALPGEGAKSSPERAKSSDAVLSERYYTPGYLNELAQLIKNKPDTTVLLVVSVPASCSWCRVYAGDLSAVAKDYRDREDVKLAIVNFDTYEEARRVMGSVVDRFPFTAVFRAGRGEARPDGVEDRAIKEPFFSNIHDTYEIFSGRRTTDHLKRTIEPPLAPGGVQSRK